MSCYSCGSLGEYRKLCNYNDDMCTSCTTKPLKLVNFQCSPGIGCHSTTAPVDQSKKIYSDVSTCNKNCVAPGKFSYNCEDTGCVIVHGIHGEHTDLSSCQKNCHSGYTVSYDCGPLQHAGSSGGAPAIGCIQYKGPQGTFATRAECNANCPAKQSQSYECGPDGNCIGLKNPGGNFATYNECIMHCARY